MLAVELSTKVADKSQANHVYELWLDKGHDDVTIEEYEDFE